MNIQQTLQVIDDLRAEGALDNYAIGGATAAVFYTLPLNTADVDIFVKVTAASSALAPFQPVLDALAAKGFTQCEKEGVLIHGWPVQFLPAHSPLENAALDAAVDRRIGAATTRVFTPEYLIAIALEVGRPKDKLRVAQFLNTPGSYDPEQLRAVLQKFGLQDKFDRWRHELQAED